MRSRLVHIDSSKLNSVPSLLTPEDKSAYVNYVKPSIVVAKLGKEKKSAALSTSPENENLIEGSSDEEAADVQKESDKESENQKDTEKGIKAAESEQQLAETKSPRQNQGPTDIKTSDLASKSSTSKEEAASETPIVRENHSNTVVIKQTVPIQIPDKRGENSKVSNAVHNSPPTRQPMQMFKAKGLFSFQGEDSTELSFEVKVTCGNFLLNPFGSGGRCVTDYSEAGRLVRS